MSVAAPVAAERDAASAAPDWPSLREQRGRDARLLAGAAGALAVLTGALVVAGGRLPVLLVALGGLCALAWLVAAPAGARAEACALLFVLLLYVNVPAVAATFHGVPASVLALSYLLALAPLAVALRRRERLVTTPALPWLLAYGGALALSAALADRPAATLPHLVTFLVEGLLLYVLVTNALRTPASIVRVVWVLVAGAALLGSLSLLQELTGTPSDFAGFAQVDDDALGIGQSTDGEPIGRDRLAGPVGEPNRYAQVLLVVLPLALVPALRARRPARRLAAGLACAVILAGILLTFSRGAVVALGLVVVAAVALRVLRPRHLALLGAGFAVVVALAAPDYVGRLESLAGVAGLGPRGAVTDDNAVLGRATSNLSSLRAFADHPLLGVGPLQYYERFSRIYANDLGLRWFEEPRRAHSLYLELAADVGLVWLVTFLAVPVVTGLQLRRESRRLRAAHPDLASLADSLLLMLVAYFGSAVFLHLAYQRYLWLFLAVAGAAGWTLSRVRSA